MVEAILMLTLPQNVKQLRRFLGVLHYYRDLMGEVKQNAVTPHQPSWRVWTHQSHTSYQDKVLAMAFG